MYVLLLEEDKNFEVKCLACESVILSFLLFLLFLQVLWSVLFSFTGDLLSRRFAFLGDLLSSIIFPCFARFSAESDNIGTVSLTYRSQADSCRESAATDVKFSLTGIPGSIRLGTPIFRYEPAGTERTGRYLEP